MKTIKITGMHCEGCVKRLSNAFKEQNITAEISLADGTAVFDDSVNTEKAVSIIEDSGFEVN